MQERRGAGGSGQARLGVVNEETCWARERERVSEREKKSENERVCSADSGGVVRKRVVCVPEKNPYNPIGTMYSCEFARLSGCSRVFGH